MRTLVALGLALLFAGSSEARELLYRGGTPTPVDTASTFMCDGASSVCGRVQNGQVFITWNDLATGAAGNNSRYRLYTSIAPLDAGNFATGTLIASNIPNNSAQLVNGDPASSSTNPYTQSYRQDATRPMARIADLGTPLAPYTGLQVYTILAPRTSYYAVVSTNATDGSPVFLGKVGPLLETVAPIQAYKQYDNSRSTTGKITSPTAGMAVLVRAHGSSFGSGCVTQACTYGDYWSMWGTTEAGWQDGRPMTLQVAQFNTQYPPMTIRVRDDTNTPDATGTIGMEWWHSGGMLTPNPLVGPANRWYPFVRKGEEQIVSWAIDKYGFDPNKINWSGQSMGAVGGLNSGIRSTNPKYATVNAVFPLFNFSRKSCSDWAGLTWTSGMPFKATLNATPCTGGSASPNLIKLPDGSDWAGPGGYTDNKAFFESNVGTDIPFVLAAIGKQDSIILSTPSNGVVLDAIDGIAGLRNGKRGHGIAWSFGEHDNEETDANVSCTPLGGTVNTNACFDLAKLARNLPAAVFTDQSIDDDIGTGTQDAFGIFDGDHAGVVGIGGRWTFTTDTPTNLNFTIFNTWMLQPQNVNPSSTLSGPLASSGASTFTVADGTPFVRGAGGTTGSNPYFLIDGKEIIRTLSMSGNTITFTNQSNRGRLYTTARSHAAGVSVVQVRSQTTGPVHGGPYASMTADITLRRLQGFIQPEGTTINCNVTPFGGATVAKSGVVVGGEGVFTLTNMTVNAGGPTSVACVPA